MVLPGTLGTKTDRLLRRGVAAHQSGEFKQAERYYREILAIQPEHADALRFLGQVVAQRGDMRAALSLFQRAVSCRPYDPASHFDLGNAHFATKDYQAAAQSFRQVTVLAATFAAGHHGLGMALERQGKLDAALVCYQQAVHLEPNFAAAQLAMGGVLHDLYRLDEAIAAYRRSLELNPDWCDARFNLGRALADQCRYAEAESEYRLALCADPDAVHTLVNLASALMSQYQFREAKVLVERVLTLDPRCVHALYDLAILMRWELRFADAETYYRRALEVEPDNRDARFSLADLSLGAGDFTNGWPGYRERLSRRQFQYDFPEVELAAELPRDLSGKQVVLLKEQGMGDELFFLRFAIALKRRGAILVCRTSPQLTGPLSRVSHLDELDDKTSMNVVAHRGVAVLMGDLPLVCAGEEATPAPLRLTVLPERLAAMSVRFTQLGPPPYRGVTWRAGTSTEERQLRGGRVDLLYKELPLEQFAAALRGTSGTWIALQRNPKPGELAQFERSLGRPLHDLTEYNNDLEDMLAVLTLLDDYIGVSNTNTHLGAGICKTQHVLVPRPPEWRWMSEGAASPWFPGFPLYRQRGDGDWSPALDALTVRLGR